MTLYTLAEKNVRRTWLLMSVFLIFIIGLGWLFSYLLNNSIFLVIAFIVAIFQGILSYWYSDKIVLAMARAKPIEKNDNPELYRIVENLCMTAGLPLPKIYILNENQPNAFATGRNEKHAVIAVTRGLLEKLDRTELEGVIAHELSHIGDKDMFLQTIVVVLVGIIAMVSNFFLRISFWGRSGRREEGSGEDRSAAIFAIFGIIAAVLAPIVATLIQLAISRKREFLADAKGGLLTRYPEGLARALEKISQDTNLLRVANNSTAHLYIVSPFRGKEAQSWLTKLFSTHPPVEERIAALRELQI
jgi:heat shock protein HtpX